MGDIRIVRGTGAHSRRKTGGRSRARAIFLAALVIVSFAAGMFTHSLISRPPQPDAGLSYIEDIPVYTDYIPEGSRARPGETREIKYLVIHETDNFSAGADAAAHNSFIHQTAYHAGDQMEKNGGNMNGIGIEMCVNEDGNYEQTLINTEKLCARLLLEYDLNPDKALKKHQDFSGKVCPAKLINDGRWDEFCAAVKQKYEELKAADANS